VPTPTERRIIQERRAKKTGAMLVPILEELLELDTSTGPSTPDDFRFMDMLIKARALPRRKGVFSPSMLGSCVRQAYFAKRDVDKHSAANPQTHGYFLKGNFVHLQWQFALWRAHVAGLIELVPVPIEHELEILNEMVTAKVITLRQADQWAKALDFNGDGMRPAVEVRVVNGDFGGTVDALVRFIQAAKKSVAVVDFKGINVIDFQRTIKRGAEPKYRVQLVGYGDNVNESELPYQVDFCLLVCENKAGPTNSSSSSPLALHETKVDVVEHMPEVRRRLKTLRWYDSRDEVPPPECVSTNHMMFQECAFNRFCREEVREVQREHEDRAQKRARNWKPARTKR